MVVVGNMTLFFSEKDQFSNWYLSDFEVKGVRFNCVEQFMMYCKAKLFGDEQSASRILEARQPRAQKSLGRRVTGFEEIEWCARRERIVVAGCYAKFSQCPPLRDALLATGTTILVEASPYDCIWGVGLGERDPRVLDPQQWKGLNLLGDALATVRATLRAQATT